MLGSLDSSLVARPIVLTQPEPWAMVQPLLPADATTVHLVTEIEHKPARVRIAGFPADATCVIGLGGGLALDYAKLTASTLGLPLVLVPSILSVDAGFTRKAGVREDANVKYVGDISGVLRFILIDFDILQASVPSSTAGEDTGETKAAHCGTKEPPGSRKIERTMRYTAQTAHCQRESSKGVSRGGRA